MVVEVCAEVAEASSAAITEMAASMTSLIETSAETTTKICSLLSLKLVNVAEAVVTCS